jgi:invasion protein IalB
MVRTDANLRFAPLVATIAVAVLFFSDASRAQTPPPPRTQVGTPARSATPQSERHEAPGWTVNCVNSGKGLDCKAAQTIVLAKTRQLLLSASVNKPAGDESAALLLRLPHGLFNPAGVTVAVDDGKPEMLEIQTCDAKGCYAGQAIPPGKLAEMSKGRKLLVSFQNLKKQKITVPLPLKGFAQAYSKL